MKLFYLFCCLGAYAPNHASNEGASEWHNSVSYKKIKSYIEDIKSENPYVIAFLEKTKIMLEKPHYEETVLENLDLIEFVELTKKCLEKNLSNELGEGLRKEVYDLCNTLFSLPSTADCGPLTQKLSKIIEEFKMKSPNALASLDTVIYFKESIQNLIQHFQNFA